MVASSSLRLGPEWQCWDDSTDSVLGKLDIPMNDAPY